ncbi:MAG: hypothetical protein US40_C0011G0024 [Candidatus Roizmanbacteria bacterium GW2011_GWC2_37_13]|uniref:Uncharacterized protein n=1 Tax=Candidatus Roizmanbacteria bacterium GW2011_GWC2_37_13 TaxID=1618486 RepID=A0A0G0ILR2_9BACT|nr:MAG: hypothetical protein US38_C0007G0024 [Candidatus Roizmanbacteria bacterium GW2011_GWC1_37_12]KKQ25139.1 MAG: hypothetical protein US40_C0011G0024 [Candidatus Roizmanbacteria bacterium GW2011_GWC2_37_13]
MNLNEALKITEIVIGSVAGLATMFFAGKVILKNLGLWHSSNSNQNSNNSSEPSVSMGSPQTDGRDKRPVGREVQRAGTRLRRRRR